MQWNFCFARDVQKVKKNFKVRKPRNFFKGQIVNIPVVFSKPTLFIKILISMYSTFKEMSEQENP